MRVHRQVGGTYRITKPDWRQQLESLTGMDPSRCEVCGQKALRLVEEFMPARAPGSTRMILSLIDQFPYLFAHPRRRGVVCLDRHCGILGETKSRFRSPSMRQNPSLAGPRNARLSGLVGWRRGQPVKRPARD